MGYRNKGLASSGSVSISSGLDAADKAKLDRLTVPEPKGFAFSESDMLALQQLVPGADALEGYANATFITPISEAKILVHNGGFVQWVDSTASLPLGGGEVAVFLDGSTGKINPQYLPEASGGTDGPTDAEFAAYTASNQAALNTKYDKTGGLISGNVRINDGGAVDFITADPRFSPADSVGYEQSTDNGLTYHSITTDVGAYTRRVSTTDHLTAQVTYTQQVNFSNGIDLNGTTLDKAQLDTLLAGNVLAWNTSTAVLLGGTSLNSGTLTLPAEASAATEAVVRFTAFRDVGTGGSVNSLSLGPVRLKDDATGATLSETGPLEEHNRNNSTGTQVTEVALAGAVLVPVTNGKVGWSCPNNDLASFFLESWR